MRRWGGDKIRHTRLVSEKTGGRGKTGSSLTCRAGTLHGRGGEGRTQRAQGPAPGLATLPGGAGWHRAPGGRKGGAERGARARGARGQQRREKGVQPHVPGGRGRWDPDGCGALTLCGSSTGFAGGGGSSGGGSNSSTSSTAPPSLRRLLRLRSPPPPTTTFGDVTPVT